jgi:hypothetical protein
MVEGAEALSDAHRNSVAWNGIRYAGAIRSSPGGGLVNVFVNGTSRDGADGS